MSVNGQVLERLVLQAQQLPPLDRLRLIQQVAETLIQSPSTRSPQRLVYGQFKGMRMSTDDDFVIAEWRPTQEDLNGA